MPANSNSYEPLSCPRNGPYRRAQLRELTMFRRRTAAESIGFDRILVESARDVVAAYSQCAPLRTWHRRSGRLPVQHLAHHIGMAALVMLLKIGRAPCMHQIDHNK